MPKKPTYVVARLMWIAPALLVLYGLYLLKAPLDYRRTLQHGVLAEAQVRELHLDNRKDVSMDHITLAVTLPDGREVVAERMPLPFSLAQVVEGRETLPVRVLPDSPKPIVIVSNGGQIPMGRALWRLSAISGVMCLVTALMLGFGVAWWNRYLNRYGDPAERVVTEPAVALR